MKRYNVARRLGPPRLILALTILFCGCTHLASKRAKAHGELEEHSRALTTAVVDALQLQPPDLRDSYTEFALRVAREDQRVEGLPLDPIAVEPFVQPDRTNALPKIKAERALQARFTEIEKLLAVEKRATDRLLDFGATQEEHQNASRLRWTKWIGGTALLLGGIVALCVFFPVAIPIFGRILGWIVSKIPSLAGAIGVVSVKAFDAIVRGIERTKSDPGSVSRLPNQAVTASNDDWRAQLHLNLSREMDAAHKALVRARKTALPANGGLP
jgi:hypothetical protein